MINPKIEYLALFLLFLCMGLIIVIFQEGKKKKHKKHKRHNDLRLNIHFHNKHKHFTMALNQLTLTDKSVHTGVISVFDKVSGNTLTGTLANIQATDSDTTQDTVAVDPSVANTLDVQAVSNTGGSVLNFSADFTSQGNTALGIADGTFFTAVPGQATLINQIPTSAQPALNITF